MQIDRVDIGKAKAETPFEENLEKSFQRLMDQIVQVLNKGLLFSDNFSAYIGTVTTDATPGNETEIAHGLKKVPSGYLVLSRDKSGVIYNGASAWTSSKLFIRSNTASVTIKIMIF